MDAADALRAGELARAHVLTRVLPPGEPPPHRRAEQLIPVDPAKARALLEPDNGPAFLALAWLDSQRRDSTAVLTPYAAAAALQRDAREAAAIVGERHGDKSPAYVAFQAFRLWNTPFARAAALESLAPFLDLLGGGARRAAHRALYLRLRALSLPCPPPEPLPPPSGDLDDFAAAADTPDLPSRDPARAERLLMNADLLPFIVTSWDPAWLRARWTSKEPVLARALFERLLPALDPELLAFTRGRWIVWAEALRALARFRPALAHEEAKKAPESHYPGTRARVFEGEADRKTFDVRLDLLRRVAGDPAAARAALWLLLEEPPAWMDEDRLLAALDAAGPVEPEFLSALLSTHRRIDPAGT